jgi:hypothetical protein
MDYQGKKKVKSAAGGGRGENGLLTPEHKGSFCSSCLFLSKKGLAPSKSSPCPIDTTK